MTEDRRQKSGDSVLEKKKFTNQRPKAGAVILLASKTASGRLI